MERRVARPIRLVSSGRPQPVTPCLKIKAGGGGYSGIYCLALTPSKDTVNMPLRLAGILLLGWCAVACSTDSAKDTTPGAGGDIAGPTVTERECLLDTTDVPDSASTVPCKADFDALASA